MEAAFCVDTLEDALARHGKPGHLQHGSGRAIRRQAFTGVLADNGIAISMDGKGAWRESVFVERLWRSIKYEGYTCGLMTASARRAARSADISTSTTAHQNTHLSMLLKRKDFADWDSIPWGILGSVALVRR